MTVYATIADKLAEALSERDIANREAEEQEAEADRLRHLVLEFGEWVGCLSYSLDDVRAITEKLCEAVRAKS